MVQRSSIIVLLICALLYLPVHLVGPPGFPWDGLTIGLLLIVVGGMSSLLAGKTRLLYLPLWSIGLGLVFAYAISAWSVLGGAAAFLVLLAVIVSLFALGVRREKRAWQRAPEALEEFKVALLEGKTRESFERLREAWFHPIGSLVTPEVARHDLEVLDLVQKHLLAEEDAPILVPTLRQVIEELQAVASSEEGKGATVAYRNVAPLEKWIRKRLDEERGR